jgi:hypothetical protein
LALDKALYKSRIASTERGFDTSARTEWIEVRETSELPPVPFGLSKVSKALLLTNE